MSGLCGIDEVGRGPWAGPVVAAAVILHEPVPGLADSKKLSAAVRRRLAAEIRACAVFGLGCASVAEIDRLNVLEASHLAMQRAVAALALEPARILVDGRHLPALPAPAEAIVGGDGSVPVIGAASIVAKVWRDALMARLAGRYPAYGWERNMGYGTAEHQAGLARAGVTPHHRRSFRPIRACLEAAAAG